MTDAELTRACAERVMQWTKVNEERGVVGVGTFYVYNERLSKPVAWRLGNERTTEQL